MATFFFAANAVLPIILLIFLGYYLRRIQFFDDSFLKYGNSFVFKVATPALLAYNVYSIETIQSISWSIIVFVVMIILVIYGLGLISVVCFTKDGRKRGVLLQCVFRSNFAIIGIPLAESIGGSSAVKTASIISAFSIPMFNVLAVIALTMFLKDEQGKHISIKEVGKKILKNPLIRGIAVGLFCLVIRGFIPKDSEGNYIFTIKEHLPFLYTAVKSLGAIASPFALIVLGGNFHFKAVRRLAKHIALGTAWRVVLTPVIAIAAALFLSAHTKIFEFTSVEYPAFIALFGSPVAVSSAIMAGEMGGDEELAGQLVVWTSICSVFTIFALLVVLRGMKVL